MRVEPYRLCRLKIVNGKVFIPVTILWKKLSEECGHSAGTIGWNRRGVFLSIEESDVRGQLPFRKRCSCRKLRLILS